MKKSGWVTVAVLVIAVALIVVALMRETSSGPTFRAEDHAGYDECLAAIPTEWEAGSLARSGAQDACGYVHARPAAR